MVPRISSAHVSWVWLCPRKAGPAPLRTTAGAELDGLSHRLVRGALAFPYHVPPGIRGHTKPPIAHCPLPIAHCQNPSSHGGGMHSLLDQQKKNRIAPGSPVAPESSPYVSRDPAEPLNSAALVQKGDARFARRGSHRCGRCRLPEGFTDEACLKRGGRHIGEGRKV